MELWIRSQDKGDLIKVSNIRSFDNEICTDCGYFITLGNYETIERTLEILDNIEKWITKTNENNQQVIIYEMPEE